MNTAVIEIFDGKEWRHGYRRATHATWIDPWSIYDAINELYWAGDKMPTRATIYDPESTIIAIYQCGDTPADS